ncbi:MAG: RNA polymerase sigma factor [Gemmatimonadales bacterium]
MDADEVTVLYQTYAPELRDTFRRRFPWSEDIVDDAVQHAFLQLHTATTRPHEPRAWLRTVTHHYILDRLRAEGKLVRDETALDDVAAREDPSTATEASISTTLVQRALGMLTTRAQRLLRGKYLQAKSYRTLAREEGVATSGMGRILDRARQRLRRTIDDIRHRR